VFIKRVLDFVFAVLALPFVLLVTLLISPLLYLEDRGPVFYISKRIGRNGELFNMVKFRSMKVNAPDIRLEDGSTFNSEDDPRVTKVGKILRSTSLDEIPQILNIITGKMSFIGPRPDPPDCLEKYPDNVKVFLIVRPGITGYNQAYFRNSVDSNQKINNDVYYVKNISLIGDIKILVKTVETVLSRRNTYRSNIMDQ
jgi:lipopolysaccharide/colanic/teichoic acid biosynthesis glycosyltransferase